jgi:hypothetical protein
MAGELERVVVVGGKPFVPMPHPSETPGKKNCWKRLRKHKWGDSKEYYNGRHWFKVCSECRDMEITQHVTCSKTCRMGSLGVM